MADQPVAIYTKYDFYVPAFEVKIGGQTLGDDVVRDVLSVTYTDSLDAMDSFEMTINNWDAEARDFKYVDCDIFDPGKDVELYMGYLDRGGMTLMLRGQIVSLSPDFPAGGQPTLQVRALNELYKLHFKQKTMAFEKKKDSEIAQAVLDSIMQDQSGRSSLKLELVTSSANSSIEQPHNYILINNEYPIIFLMERARHNGYDIYIEEEDQNGQTTSKLHFHPPDLGIAATYELTWGQSLINFKPTLKTRSQVATVKVRGWDPLKKKEITVEASWDDLDFKGLPNVADMSKIHSALAGSEEVVADEPIENDQEAKQKAKDHLSRMAKDLVTGSGSTVGVPELRAGRPVFIKGLGERFSGRYMITKSVHSLGDGGYTTQFDARMEELK
ncbi:MAG: phage late control D family protein [Chloroflexi bacterium]|nr:phage late control D family protein [Chloroflexota bacterium]